MTLRRKIVAAVIAAVAVCGVLAWLITDAVWGRYSDRITRVQALADMDRVFVMLDREGAELRRLARVYAEDRDVRNVVTSPPRYPAAGPVMDSVLAGHRLHVVLVADAAGKFVLTKGLDPQRQRPEAVPAGLLGVLRANPRWQQQTARGGVTASFWGLPDGFMLLAFAPIRAAWHGKTVPGTLIVGRYLDAAEQHMLADLARVEFTLLPAASSEAPARVVRELTGSDSLRPVVVEFADARTALGYSLIRDGAGNPLLVLRGAWDRQSVGSPAGYAACLGLSLLALGVVAGFLLMFVLDRLVLDRLARLTAFVDAVQTRRDVTLRCTLSGADEVTRLGAGLNRLLEQLASTLASHRGAEESLRASEAKYRSLIDSSSDPIFVVRADNTVEFANDSAARMLGLPRDAVIGKPCPGFLAPGQPGVQAHRLREALTTGKSVFETSAMRAGSRTVWLDTHWVPLRDRNGKVESVLGVCRDITQRKLTEAELRLSRERFATLFEYCPVPVLVIDLRDLPPAAEARPDGEGVELDAAAVRALAARVTIAESNRAAVELLASGAAAALSGPLSRLFVEASYEPFRLWAVQLAEGRTEGQAEFGIRTLAGEPRTAFFRWQMAPGQQPGERRAFVSVIDVTEQRRAEQELRESERRFKEVLETISLAAVMLDFEGRIAYCNTRLLALVGWDRGELLGRNLLDVLVPPPSREAMRAVHSRLIATGQAEASGECPIVTRGGETRLLVWDHTVLRDAAGRIVGTAAFGRDVTEHRRLEAQYAQAQKMEALGQLAGGVAHDFNNVLQVISGYTSMMLATLTPDRPDHDRLWRVAEAAASGSSLVRQLLAFSRQEPLSLEAIALDRVVAESTRMLRRIIGEHIDIQVRAAESLPPVRADRIRLEQVLMNLSVNARDAMPEGGVIRIDIDAVRATAESVGAGPDSAPAEFVRLTFADSGHGMSPAVMARVFDPFFTTKAQGRGSGLGLATVYAIVRQHGGAVQARSEPSRGATFVIHLPAAPGMAAEVAAAVPSVVKEPGTVTGGGETILLAEDDDLVRTLVAEVLTGSGYRVIPAQDGDVALELIERHGKEVALFVLDVVMPRKGGPAVYRAIVSQNPHARVLFCSGYSFGGLDLGHLSERCAFIEKPFSPPRLLAKVRELLDLGTATPPEPATASGAPPPP